MPNEESMPGTDIETQRAKSGFWYTEELAPGATISLSLKRILESTYSTYQKIDVVETVYGKTLVTDGKTQSAQLDEFAYHESLVHPPMILSALLSRGHDSNHTNKNSMPKTVFIGGGGELATAREVLRHRSVERVVMVDLDECVIELCKKHLPEWGGDKVATDPRLELVIGDAFEYLINCQEIFDVIIMDISDPIEAGPGVMLYTKEFYAHAKTLLNASHGVFVTQAGIAESIPLFHHMKRVLHQDTSTSCSISSSSMKMKKNEHWKSKDYDDTSCYGPIINTLNVVFDRILPYSSNIPSFGTDWGFVLAYSNPTDTVKDNKNIIDFANTPGNLINDMVSAQVSGGACDKYGLHSDELKYYDGTTHRRMFALPKPLRRVLSEDDRVITKDNPVFMY